MRFRRLRLTANVRGRRVWRAEIWDSSAERWTSPVLFSKSDKRAIDPLTAPPELQPAWRRVRDGGTPTKRHAHLRAAELAREVALRPAQQTTLDSLVDSELASGGKRGHRSPITDREVERALRAFASFMRDRYRRLEVHDVGAQHIEHFLNEFSATGCARTSVQRRRSYLHRAFQRLVELGTLTLNPVSRIKIAGPLRAEVKERTKGYVLSRKEVEKLLKACRDTFTITATVTRGRDTEPLEMDFNPPRYLHAFVLVSVRTGARVGELLPISRKGVRDTRVIGRGLTWPSVDFGRHTATISGKTGPRIVPLDSDVETALRKIHKAQESAKIVSPFVFLNDEHKPVTDPRKAFRAACVRAGINRRVRLHDLRHTCLTHLAEDGMAPAVLQAIAGHSTMAMTEKYLHIAEEAIVTAFRAMRGRAPRQRRPKK